jgi:hypothetical protein
MKRVCVCACISMYPTALLYILRSCTVCVHYYCSPLDAALVCASGGDTVRFFRVLDSEVNFNLNYLELDLSISFENVIVTY